MKQMARRNKKVTWLTELPAALAFLVLTIALPFIAVFAREMLR